MIRIALVVDLASVEDSDDFSHRCACDRRGIIVFT